MKKLRYTKLTISLAVWLIDRVHAFFLKIIKKERLGRCVVLYYHSIPKEGQERFSRQMEQLMKSTTPIRADESRSLEDGLNFTVVTFDDGFVDIRENALPILVKFGIPFIVFIATGHMGRPPIWIKDEYKRKGLKVMDSQQVAEIGKGNSLKIGSHCISHRDLKQMSDKEAREEIKESKEQLEKLIEGKVDILSFPHGSYELKHVRWAMEAGYKRVFTISPISYSKVFEDFIIGRVRVDPNDWLMEFHLKMLGAYRWEAFVFDAKKKLISLWKAWVRLSPLLK